MNAARMMFDNFDRYGEYDKLIFEGSTFTNTATTRHACCMAAVLRSYGVKAGARIAVMMSNSPAVEAAFQASWILGAAIIPITPQLGPREVGFILRDANVSVVLTSAELLDCVTQARASAECVRHVLVSGDIAAEVAAADPLQSMLDRGGSELAVLLYTSGTTGAPKGVMLSHENTLFAVEAATRKNPGMPRHRLLHALPLSHIFGVVMMNVCNAWGWSTVLMPHFETRRALELIQTHRVTRFSAVPTMLVYLIHSPHRTEYDTSSLQGVTCGGAPLPEPVRIEFESLFHAVVQQGYGMSETAAVATGYRMDEASRPGSVGTALPGIEIEIRDRSGHSLPSGQEGEIVIRGGSVMSGYWNNQAATACTLANGWLLTGDIGYLDTEGYLYITDRKKDLIIKGGENISPREIEEVIQAHPAVAEVSVIGIPDEVFGENICAVIVPRAGFHPSPGEIQDHAAQSLAKFKLPAQVIFAAALPKSPVGKVLKREIRKQYGGERYADRAGL